MSNRLKAKVAIVTGAASGFGAGIAAKFVAEGAQVLLRQIGDKRLRIDAAGGGTRASITTNRSSGGANNAPAAVDWVIAQPQANPKIIDVIAEGTSMRITQRSAAAADLGLRTLTLSGLSVGAEPSGSPQGGLGPDDVFLINSTSGTTGLPKGCMHTHGSIMHNAVASCLWGNASPDNVTLIVVPMFHITGMVSILHTSIRGGATLVIMPRWDRDLAGRLISRWKVTHWTNIPTMVIDLLGSPSFDKFDLSSLLYIGGGGAAMPQAVAQRLLDLFGLRYVEGYGLTETAAPSHTNPPDAPKQQCLGIPFMSTDARIIDPETLQEMPQGEAGEIIICGPEVFKGYWKRPDATAQAFIEHDGKRFFRSGDLGRVDEDGYFFLTDRLKRMINASGFKVWPAEVEALMYRHPAIQEACVISTPDSYRGESVKAVVVLRSTHKDLVTEQGIVDWCRENMAVYKVPRVVQFVDALPKSGAGKVMWRTLQEAEPKG